MCCSVTRRELRGNKLYKEKKLLPGGMPFAVFFITMLRCSYSGTINKIIGRISISILEEERPK